MRAWVLEIDVRHARMGIRNRRMYINICDRLWENRPLRAQYEFSVEAFVVYLT